MKFSEVEKMLLEEELILACESCHTKIIQALTKCSSTKNQEIIKKVPSPQKVIIMAKEIANSQKGSAKEIAMESYNLLMDLTSEEKETWQRLFG